ncbi:MAG TPA: hypothetical protein VGM37_03250 [Armatimonadota bacterium]|jgi:transcriptional regulator with XRE-family HTH domain
MPHNGLTMHTIREILRLRFGQRLSVRETARACHLSHSTVLDYLKRAREANLTWPLPDEMDDDALAERLRVRPESSTATRPLPDMDHLLRELRKKHVTKQLLWLEYRQITPDGYSYKQFCHYLNEARSRADPTLRQNHKAGEKLFTDCAEIRSRPRHRRARHQRQVRSHSPIRLIPDLDPFVKIIAYEAKLVAPQDVVRVSANPTRVECPCSSIDRIDY